MNPKKAVKEAEKALRKDPENLVLRLKLAAAYREVGRTQKAVELYRSVAVAYHSEGRLAQAIAVCRSVLEIEPGQRETQELLAELDRMQDERQPSQPPEPTQAARPQFFDPTAQGGGAPAPEASPPPSPLPIQPDRARPAARGHRPDSGRGSPLGQEFGSRSGLTPHSEPELAPFDTPSPAPGHPLEEASRLRERNAGRSTQRMSGPPERRSVPPLTPTPLPEPLALHQTDDSRASSVPLARDRPVRSTLRGGAPLRPPAPSGEPASQTDDDAPTRIADDVLSDDAPTTIAPDVIEEIDEFEELDEAPEPPAAQTDDDAPTRIAGAEGWAPAARSVPSYFERETRPMERAPDTEGLFGTEGGAAGGLDTRGTQRSLPRVPHPDEIGVGGRRARPAPEPKRSSDVSIPPELAAYQRGSRLLDVEGTFSEEPTDPREDDDESAVTNPGREQGDPVGGTPSSPAIDAGFDRPFSDTIDALGPEGSPLEAPLSIFHELPEDALEELARRMELRHFQPGDAVLREGDPGDACYVIAQGEVRVLKHDPTEKKRGLVEVARLADGALFGEFALLADRRRHATVQAVTSASIYEIPRRLLRELAHSYPAVGPMLERFYRERLLSTLLATAPFFQPMVEDRRGALLARFRPVRAESGDVIVREGERAGGLYLIVLGSVDITKQVEGGRSVLLATLGEGAYFGEMSLLTGGVASASVSATGPTELAVLPPKDFYELIADNPVLWAEIKREAHRRELMNNQIVAGETNVV